MSPHPTTETMLNLIFKLMSEQEEQSMQAHFKECRECRQQFELLSAQCRDAFGSNDNPETPEALVQTTLQRIHHDRKPKKSKTTIIWFGSTAIAAAALLLILLMPQQTPTENTVTQVAETPLNHSPTEIVTTTQQTPNIQDNTPMAPPLPSLDNNAYTLIPITHFDVHPTFAHNIDDTIVTEEPIELLTSVQTQPQVGTATAYVPSTSKTNARLYGGHSKAPLGPIFNEAEQGWTYRHHRNVTVTQSIREKKSSADSQEWLVELKAQNDSDTTAELDIEIALLPGYEITIDEPIPLVTDDNDIHYLKLSLDPGEKESVSYEIHHPLR